MRKCYKTMATAPRSTTSGRDDAGGDGTISQRVLGARIRPQWHMRVPGETREPSSAPARRRRRVSHHVKKKKRRDYLSPAHLAVEGPREVVQLVRRLVHARVREGDARQIGHAPAS